MKKNLLAAVLLTGIVSVTAAPAISALGLSGHRGTVKAEKSTKTKKAAPIHFKARKALFAAPAAPNISYASPQTYMVGVAITPLTPTNSGGAIPARPYGQVATVAGDGTTNIFDHPTGVAVGMVNNVYTIFVVDAGHSQTKKITSSNGVYTVATLNIGANSVAIDFSQYDEILAIVGQGGGVGFFRELTPGSYEITGDPYTWTNSRGIVYLGTGFFYISQGNRVFYEEGDGGPGVSFGNSSPGMVNSSTPSTVRFNAPIGLGRDNNGNLFIADAGNNAIRKLIPGDPYVNPGLVTTFAGNGTAGPADGVGSTARFNNPTGVVCDWAGNIYVADAGNNKIRKITPGRVVTTIAGTGVAGSANGKGSVATFNNPRGITIDDTGLLYIADTDNNLIRSVSATGYTISPALPAGLSFDSSTGIISGTPTGRTAATDYTVTAYNSGGSSSFVVNIAVAGIPPVISYPGNPHMFTKGVAITPLVPNNAGGPVPANVYGMVTTLTGSPTAGSTDGPKSIATFNGPSDIAIDSIGSIYVADYGNYKVRKITPSGVVNTFAGSGSAGSANLVRTAASFNSPAGLDVDAAGNIYVADVNNYKIRKISPLGGASTAAGAGTAGVLNGTPGNSTFNRPYAVHVDPDGNVLIADTYNNLARKLVPGVGVTTVASSVTFNHPQGITNDVSGNIFLSDFGSNKIYKMTHSGAGYTTTTFAGSGADGTANGTKTVASFSGPRGMAFDVSGNLYVSDYNSSLIRRISPTGVVTTLAGVVGTHGSTDGEGTAASFWNPAGMAIDKTGNLYVADYSNNMVRKISLTGYSLSPGLPSGLTFDATTGIISGTPKQTLAPKTYTVTAYNAFGSSTTTMSIGVQLPSMFMATSLQDEPIAAEPDVKKSLSPNGDGINDVLTIENIEQYPDNKMTILNAAGAKVYEASGYGTNGKLFDGHSSTSGKMQSPGTYLYMLEYRSPEGIERKTGYFVLKQ